VGDAVNDASSEAAITVTARDEAVAAKNAAVAAKVAAETAETNAEAAAASTVIPAQSGNSGKYLKTNGTDTSWDALDISTADVSGTLPIANGGTGSTTAQTAINTLAGAVTSGSYLRGSGTNVVMSAIQVADIPTLNQNTTGTAANVTGTVAVANGGTGSTTAPNALTALGAYPATNPSGYTTNTGTVTSVAATVPAFLSVTGSPVTTSGTLAITYSGTALPIANGGTNGTATPTLGGVIVGTGTSYDSTAAGTSGQILTSNGASAPTWQAAPVSLPSQTGNSGKYLTTDGSAASWATVAAGNTTRFKNRIINGDMRIDQRNAGALTNPAVNGNYYLDRWRAISGAAGKYSIGQNAGSITPPVGFINYCGLTSLSSYTVGASEVFGLRHSIEGLNVADLAWGTANAKTVTLSFWVRSSLTGTFGATIRNSAQDRTYPITYSIPTANTWTQITATVVGDTSGTWLTTNGVGIELQFSIGAGATVSGGTVGAWNATNYQAPSGCVSVVGTNGATFYITGVQLEVGSSATGFEYVDYTTQLLMCQRYYTKFTCPGSTVFMMGIINVTTNVYGGSLTLPATMRTTPTLAQASLRCYDANASNVISAIASNQSSKEVVSAEFTTSGMTVGRSGVISGNDNSSAFISAFAEL
jgi:hypothetical protein